VERIRPERLESRIPPPVVALVVAFAMRMLSGAIPLLAVPDVVALCVAAALGIAGVSIEASAVVAMVRARTTVDPIHPRRASTLVVDGVFRFTRNPIYLGDLLLLLAWAAYLMSPGAASLCLIFVLYIDRFQIRPEERALSELFGARYDEYRSRVRRWL
jgi:protein-S-isoprenylcysteine O-methyltransferase Ste14